MNNGDTLADLERRCIRLEEDLAFQDATIGALNNALTSQQQQLDEATQRVSELEQRFRDLWEHLQQEPQGAPPPHYQQVR